MEFTSQGRRRFGMGPVRAPDAPDVGVAHGLPGLNMKARDKAASDKPNTKSFHGNL
nr:hypothetical protein [Rhodothermus marinus]